MGGAVVQQVYQADGLSLDVIVEIEPGAIISTLIGCTAECHAMPSNGGAAIAGTATVQNATKIRAVFAAWSLPATSVAVQVRAIPAVGNGITVFDDQVEVRQSIRPNPAA